MIRISAIIWVVVLALLGIGLFQVKYNVQTKERELREVRRQIEANYSSIHVLEAEWSYLNDPLRLSDLARRHTGLVPTTPGQIGDFAGLPPRIEDAPANAGTARGATAAAGFQRAASAQGRTRAAGRAGEGRHAAGR